MTDGVQERHRLTAGFTADGGLLGQDEGDGSSFEQAAQALVAFFGGGAQVSKMPHAPIAARQDMLQKAEHPVRMLR